MEEKKGRTKDNIKKEEKEYVEEMQEKEKGP